VATKQINGCRVQTVTVLPDIEEYQNTTSVKGPALGFHAVTAPEDCVADLEWRISGSAGTLSGSGKTATFTPTVRQAAAPADAVIVANDKRDTTGKTFGTAKVFVEPLRVNIRDVVTPCESLADPYKCDNSFISLDQIQGIAQISPPAAHDVFKGNIQWEVSETEADGTLIPTGKYGEEAAWKPNPPVKPFSRFPYKLRYRINAKLVFPDLTVEATAYNIMQDMRDGLRQEYTAHDVNVPPVPERKDIVDVGQYVDPGDFPFNKVNSGLYSDLMIFKIAQELQNVSDELFSEREDSGGIAIVNSGYRNPAKNITIDDAAINSNHQFGAAVDVKVEDFNNDTKLPWRVKVDGKWVVKSDAKNEEGIDKDWDMLRKIAEANGAKVENYAKTGTWVHMEW
jgi:hypothetical protein